MSDLARDPVFGEVARALSVLAVVQIDGRRGTGVLPRSLARETGWIEVTFRAGTLPTTERARLAAMSPSLLPTLSAPGRERLGCPRFALGPPSDLHPVIAAILAAHDRAEAPSSSPRLMGVVNVTPDSFSDGGEFADPSRAIEHALQLVEDGADLLDVGGESTRPRAEPVTLAEELRRVVPVVESLAKRTAIPISIDTTKSEVARAALDAGATIVNDVSAGRFDERMLGVVAAHGAGYVAMHMQGDPRTMQAAPQYGDVVADVLEDLRERCYLALEAGIDRSKLWIDPGVGFGKTLEHNLELLRRLAELRSLGLPIVLGVSRKSFIAKITGRDTPPRERIGGSAAALVMGVLHGAEILRVHDVAAMREAALVARAIAGA